MIWLCMLTCFCIMTAWFCVLTTWVSFFCCIFWSTWFRYYVDEICFLFRYFASWDLIFILFCFLGWRDLFFVILWHVDLILVIFACYQGLVLVMSCILTRPGLVCSACWPRFMIVVFACYRNLVCSFFFRVLMTWFSFSLHMLTSKYLVVVTRITFQDSLSFPPRKAC